MMTGIDPNAALGGEMAGYILAGATGDLSAQRLMRDSCLRAMQEKACAGSFAEAHAHSLEAMFWGRLAASHGNDDDAVILTSALAYLAEYWGCHQEDRGHGSDMLSEAFSILDRLASNGNEDVAIALNHLAEQVPPRILRQARDITEMVDAGC